MEQQREQQPSYRNAVTNTNPRQHVHPVTPVSVPAASSSVPAAPEPPRDAICSEPGTTRTTHQDDSYL